MKKDARKGVRQAAPPTPIQIARFGHIAAALRKHMQEHDMSYGDLNVALGMRRGSTGIYHWVGGRGAPSERHRETLHRVTGIPISELIARDVESAHVAPESRGAGIVPESRGVRPAKPAGDVLTFNVGQDGEARIRLDVSLPVQQAMPLVRMLLDAGVVMNNEGVTQ